MHLSKCDTIQTVFIHLFLISREGLRMHSYAQGYLPTLQSFQPELLQRLERLVNIDSGSGQVEGVNQIVTCLEQWLSDTGFAVTLHPTDHFRSNLVAMRQGRGRLRLLLVGHVDTVYPQGAVATSRY